LIDFKMINLPGRQLDSPRIDAPGCTR